MTIPEKYRPKNYKYVSYRTQDGYDMLVIIQTDGKVLLFNNNKAVSGLFLRQTITYPATWFSLSQLRIAKIAVSTFYDPTSGISQIQHRSVFMVTVYKAEYAEIISIN